MEKQSGKITKSLTPKTFTVMSLGAIGFFIGYGIVLYGSSSSSSSSDCCSKNFTTTPLFTVWLYLISAQTALWAILVKPLWTALYQLKKYFLSNKKEILLSLLILTFLFFWLLLGNSFRTGSPLKGHSYKIEILTVIGFVSIVAPAFVGIWLVCAALKTSFINESSANQQIISYLRLREHLQLFLLVAGTGIGAATLATGALRNAIIAWAKSSTILDICKSKIAAINFPPDMVLLFGLSLSGLLALAYAPTFTTLLAEGRKLRDSIFPMPSLNSESWANWYSSRKNLEELLQLQLSITDSFKTGVVILAPLMGSAISLLLGAK